MNVIKSKTIGKLCHITSASLQNDITYTLHQHFPEPYGNRIPIQILQKTVCRCIDHFIYGFLIKIFRYSCRNLINTAFKGKRIIGAAVNMLQPGKNRFFMFFPQMPYKRISADSFCFVHIRHIKDIPQPRSFAFSIQKSDSFCSPVYPAKHLLIPHFKRGTGYCVRSLCVYENLILKRILVQP